MAYNDNIPNSGDLISPSQGQIKANFQAIDSATFGFARNHVALTDGTSGGLHKRIDYFASAADPSLSGFVSSLYARGASSELFYYNASGATQITSAALPIWKGGLGGSSGVITDTNAGNGAMNFPNGIQFRWGSASVNTGGTTVNYSSAFSTGTYSVVLTPVSNTSRTAAENNIGASGFTAYSENNGTTMYYFAVGH